MSEAVRAEAPGEAAHMSYEVKDGIGLITLNRPDKLNAWTGEMEKGVKRAVGAAAKDDKVRVIVLTGAGRGFCAGADMNLLQSIEPEGGRRNIVSKEEEEAVDLSYDHGPSVIEHFHGRFGYLFECPKPIIGAINGACAGLGLVVSLFCDLRFASEEAKFTTSFAQRGLVAEHGIAWLLPRLIGSAHALDLLMSARKIDGREAARLGLVNQAFPADKFMEEVMAYARHMAANVSPRSMAVMKRQVYKSLFQDFNQSTGMADKEMQASFKSADFKEGVAHFVEKRAAHFTGR
jgi:enoyl-CoA hydratase/carnithine racemase